MEAFRLSSRVRAASRAAAAGGSLAQSLAARTPFRAAHLALARSTATPAPPAAPVPVPWKVTARSNTGVIEVEHRGVGPLRAVRLMLAGGGLLGLSLPRTVYPNERLRVVVRGVYADGAIAAPDAMLVLRWFEPDGREMLWPIAL